MSSSPHSSAHQPSGHGHDHGHDHHHGHHHHELPSQLGRAFAIGIGLNLTFVVMEIVIGIYANSLGLIADAGHNFGDVIGLMLAAAAVFLATRAPNSRYTYGLRGGTILAALTNAMLLLVGVGAILWASVLRLANPAPVNTEMVMLVALVGIAVNGGTALLFLRDRKRDLNARAAFLHMAADAAVSLGVVVSALIIRFTGLAWIDPLVGIAIGLFIFASTWRVLVESARLALQGVPHAVDLHSIEHYLSAQPGVSGIHDLHVWAMSTTENALTAHLVMPAGHPGDRAMKQIRDGIAERFSIDHVTLQLELGDSCGGCELRHVPSGGSCLVRRSDRSIRCA